MIVMTVSFLTINVLATVIVTVTLSLIWLTTFSVKALLKVKSVEVF